MTNFKDYYFILGIVRTAAQEDIERAYRYSLGVINSTGAQSSILRDINEAYECLRNPLSRRRYDDELNIVSPPPPSPEKVNPGLRASSTRETLEYCFVAMKKKKSRSLPSLGRFLSAMLFLASVGYSASMGLNYFKTGHLSLSPLKSQVSSISAAQAPVLAPNSDSARANTQTPQTPQPTAPTPPKPSGENYVKVYNIRYGGVISASNAACRKDPSPNSPILVRMPYNAVVYVTKETRDGNGTTWYYVDGRTGKGWVRGGEVKVYK
ncbi:MAG: SH3 domain-containing protein [Synergistaceae bacterium]|jgi:hypothetical protein|nr:SH3 domain-containing protein [Synergistaceae bacterium]